MSNVKMLIIRRFSQLAFLILFVILFVKTDYNGSDQINGAVNILFRLDPYLASCVMIGAKTLIALFVPAFIVVLLTLVTGRGFCGWFCPMGSLLDLWSRLLPRKKTKQRTYFPNLSKLLLLFTLLSSLFGFSAAGYLDPFSILVRAMAQTIYPGLNSLTVGFFTFTYQNLPDFINNVTEPVYALLQTTILPSEQKFFQLAYLSFVILIIVFLLEQLQRRFFCRNICPLGAMLGLTGRRGLLSACSGDEDCKSCRLCSTHCRMGAVDETRSIDMSSCNLCYECVEKCPRQVINFSFGLNKVPDKSVSQVSLGRRRFLGTAVAGLCFPSIKSIGALKSNPDPLLIRPPGAAREAEFLSRCIRCGECLQVCVGNALQPAFLRAGIDGMFSPVLVARTGYCEFNCTLCGQVCPTGAIKQLQLKEKWQAKIGHAWFDKNRCLPYAKSVSCMVCEEHCPTPEKAIQFKNVMITETTGKLVNIKQPYIVDELCIGCGICETKCPLPGKAAIYITSAGEHRNPERMIFHTPTTFDNYPQ